MKSALPSHLKPGNGKEGEDANFERRHGKTRSHMVSSHAPSPLMALLPAPSLPVPHRLRPPFPNRPPTTHACLIASPSLAPAAIMAGRAPGGCSKAAVGGIGDAAARIS